MHLEFQLCKIFKVEFVRISYTWHALDFVNGLATSVFEARRIPDLFLNRVEFPLELITQQAEPDFSPFRKQLRSCSTDPLARSGGESSMRALSKNAQPLPP